MDAQPALADHRTRLPIHLLVIIPKSGTRVFAGFSLDYLGELLNDEEGRKKIVDDHGGRKRRKKIANMEKS